MLTNNGEPIRIEYRKTDNVLVSSPYYDFPQIYSGNGNYILGVCSVNGISFRYGVSGYQFVEDVGIEVVTGGKCDNSEWCGGADPYIPPPPTPTPTTYGYYCDYGTGCIGQIDPCPYNSIDCGGNEQV
jgi:hypothetical protein